MLTITEQSVHFALISSVPILVIWKTAALLISLGCCKEGNMCRFKVLGFVDDNDPMAGMEGLLTGY